MNKAIVLVNVDNTVALITPVLFSLGLFQVGYSDKLYEYTNNIENLPKLPFLKNTIVEYYIEL